MWFDDNIALSLFSFFKIEWRFTGYVLSVGALIDLRIGGQHRRWNGFRRAFARWASECETGPGYTNRGKRSARGRSSNGAKREPLSGGTMRCSGNRGRKAGQTIRGTTKVHSERLVVMLLLSALFNVGSMRSNGSTGCSRCRMSNGWGRKCKIDVETFSFDAIKGKISHPQDNSSCLVGFNNLATQSLKVVFNDQPEARRTQENNQNVCFAVCSSTQLKMRLHHIQFLDS